VNSAKKQQMQSTVESGSPAPFEAGNEQKVRLEPTDISVDESIDIKSTIPFVAMHLAGLCAFFFDFNMTMFWLILGSYYIRMFGITAGYHRYFSHRSYKTSRFFQFFLAFLAQTSAQKGVLWWAAHHRHHHKHSDSQHDIHSPAKRGFWWSQVGWILCNRYIDTNWKYIGDFAKFPELRWLNRYYLVPPLIYAITIFAIWGWAGLFWGFFFSTVLLYHGTFSINTLTHMFGRVRYKSNDESKNSLILALITCGEGWHNNHHYYQATANQGWFWWEIDISYYILRILKLFGIVWDLRAPPKHIKQNTIAFSAKGSN
jgi:stearoyl-CoA desaturase (delta-9 desaturase)